MRFACIIIGSLLCTGMLYSCKVTGQVSQRSVNTFLNDTAVRTGHAGISIYDPAAKKYLYNYNAEKNFTPSSNVKLFTLYAGMKYLGDSLVGLRYKKLEDTTMIFATGDPTFLHPDFNSQKVYAFLKNAKSIIFCSQYFFEGLGAGWAWDDYLEDFMVQKSEFPVYGNLLRFRVSDTGISSIPKSILLHANNYSHQKNTAFDWKFYRDWSSNEAYGSTTSMKPISNEYKIPMATGNYDLMEFVADTIHISISTVGNKIEDSIEFNDKRLFKIYSRPVDSLFRPMMFNSDNFFAEQTLLMVSNEKLGYMSDEQIIDTLLKTDFKDIPTKPRWVDGSGLSRYDLFSPKDFIYILNKLQSEFGLARMKRILPTGGQGTLTNYYESDAGFIYAKTGSMSNNVSLSGYLITKKNQALIFSVIINNFDGSGKSGRRAIEKLLKEVRDSN